jgi:amidase
VVDLAVALGALQGRDPDDPATSDYPDDQVTDYAAALDPDALRGARLGLWHVANESDEIKAIIQSGVDALKAAGADVVEVELPNVAEVGTHELPAMWSELRHDLEAYLATRPGAPATLAELIAFNEADPVELSKFPQDHFEHAAKAPALIDAEYVEHRTTARRLAREAIDETLATQRLDAIVAVTNGPAWPITYYPDGDRGIVGSSGAAAVAGYPAVTVPAGFVGPLPIGVTFFGARFADARMLALAAAFEERTRARRAPTFQPSLNVEQPVD